MTARAVRVLVAGAHGQVGRALQRTRPAQVELIAVDRDQLDITDRAAVTDAVRRARPDVVINAAAYTAVDRAEQEAGVAMHVNRDGAAHLAEAAQAVSARSIYLSTDYVFDGTKSTPYRPDDDPNPINAYGETKLAGERAVVDRTAGTALIVRTAWVYAAAGHNFVQTMLRLLGERPEVRVVSDQIGSPCHAAGLAEMLWACAVRADLSGTLHWTDAGVASWYDFAHAIRDEAQALFQRPPGRLVPIVTAEYPTPARRPMYSVLDKTAAWRVLGPGDHWRESLRRCLREVRGAGP